MGMSIRTPGIHHLALRVADYDRSRRFYAETLGFPVALEQAGLLIFLVGGTAVAIRAPSTETSVGDVFDPFRVGLDHVAIACPAEDELERVAEALEDHGVPNTGVRVDETLGKRYVAFKDPDRIAWEFYMA